MAVPNSLEFTELPAHELSEIASLIDRVCSSLSQQLKWEPARVDRWKSAIERICLNPVADFELKQVPNAVFQSEQAREQHHARNAIYWLELDQYVYRYRVETTKLLRRRIIAALNLLEDHVTLAFIARQIIEIVANAIANQWVLTASS